MHYPESVICNEIRWEYGYSKKRALELIEQYKSEGRYGVLCRLIERRNSKP